MRDFPKLICALAYMATYDQDKLERLCTKAELARAMSVDPRSLSGARLKPIALLASGSRTWLETKDIRFPPSSYGSNPGCAKLSNDSVPFPPNHLRTKRRREMVPAALRLWMSWFATRQGQRDTLESIRTELVRGDALNGRRQMTKDST